MFLLNKSFKNLVDIFPCYFSFLAGIYFKNENIFVASKVYKYIYFLIRVIICVAAVHANAAVGFPWLRIVCFSCNFWPFCLCRQVDAAADEEYDEAPDSAGIDRATSQLERQATEGSQQQMDG